MKSEPSILTLVFSAALPQVPLCHAILKSSSSRQGTGGGIKFASAHLKFISYAKAGVCLLTVFCSGGLRAQSHDSGPKWFDLTKKNAWLIPYDTTLITRRAVSEFSYESDDNGDHWKIENSFRGAYAIGDDLAFGLQMLLPVKWSNTTASDDFGLGDLEFRSGFIGRISPALRWGAGMNMEFDTATQPDLGSSALILRPTLSLRWDANDRVNLGINVEYNFTPKEEQANDVSALELKFPLVVKLTDQWSGAASYKPKWNLLSESDRHRVEFGATRVWGPKNEYSLSLGIEVPLNSEAFEYKLASGLAWHF